MLLELQRDIIYGPVNSRRLGRSLGINVLPPGEKVCSLNCQYCQYGWTLHECLEGETKIKFPPVEKIISELEHTLSKINQPPAYLTFSGNGEPTIHPQFDKIVDKVIHLREKKAPFIKTAILSNSTTVNNKSIRETLARLDVRIMKLDAGNQKTFSKFNQPIYQIDLDSIINGLINLKNVTIQILFSKGPAGNSDLRHIEDWIKVIKKIDPVTVQLYTLDRPAPSNKIFALSSDELFQIQNQMKKEKLTAMVF